MFLLVPSSKSKFFTRVALVSFVQHSCRQCSTRVALVLHSCLTVFHSCRSCRTRVASVALVSHSCCKIRLDLQRRFVSKVSGLQFHRRFILYRCFLITFFRPIFCRTSHNLICNKSAILKNKKLTKILKVGRLRNIIINTFSQVTKLSTARLTLGTRITNIKNS